jgi:hypothetical protein
MAKTNNDLNKVPCARFVNEQDSSLTQTEKD